ncbi:hypothetical protein P12x_005391 [Tundrisphaera lichenicola]|uniref:hypothetical protein n=1 Tax=Tundrisphaera lichenicola TaxID=2029860 RepID=UPI003EBFAE9B
MEWLDPWWSTAEWGQEVAVTLERELVREVGPGHPLHGIPSKAIGKHASCDEVLFQLLDGTGRVAVVHLTWSRYLPEEPPWPATEIYSSLEEWAELGMRPDSEECRGTPGQASLLGPSEDRWFEVWADDRGLDLPYLLIVRPAPDGKRRLRVFDPNQGNRVVFESEDYEVVKIWLLEGEFELVRGRSR